MSIKRVAAVTVVAVAVVFCVGCGNSGGKSATVQAADGNVSATFLDSRDGKWYRQAKIGSQVWMAENLNYAAAGSKCYDNNPFSCNNYGRLYNWETAKGACPAGWHLASSAEWKTLVEYAGGEDLAGTKLKASANWSNTYMNGVPEAPVGTNDFGFSALPSGYGERRDHDKDYNEQSLVERFSSNGKDTTTNSVYKRYGTNAVDSWWWGATEEGGKAWMVRIQLHQNVDMGFVGEPDDFFSVRCVRD